MYTTSSEDEDELDALLEVVDDGGLRRPREIFLVPLFSPPTRDASLTLRRLTVSSGSNCGDDILRDLLRW